MKSTSEHKYYGSLTAIFIDQANPDLRISKATLDRFNFDCPFENDVCIIRKGFLITTVDIRKLNGGAQ